MSKYKLRNLHNERRRIDKQLAKVNKEIGRIENTRVITKGKIEIKSLVHITESELLLESNNIDFSVKFDIEFKRFENEIVCKLTIDDEKFDEVMEFTGMAVCAEDEEFDMATGMTIAQNRAIKEVYEFIIGLFA